MALSVSGLLDAFAGSRIVDLGQELSAAMPQTPDHPQFVLAPTVRHTDARVLAGFRPEDDTGFAGTSEVIVMSGHSGTHLDGLGHVSCHGLVYGGHAAGEVQDHGGMHVHGLETVEPIIGRGVLFDVARAEGVDVLPFDYAIGAEVLARIQVEKGIDLRPGDSVLLRTGLGASWDDRTGYPVTGSVPGLDASGGEWLAERDVRLVGADNVALEVLGPGHALLPVHVLFLAQRGIFILEHLALEELAAVDPDEFLLVCLPLKLRGASGSPVRPIAVIPG